MKRKEFECCDYFYITTTSDCTFITIIYNQLWSFCNNLRGKCAGDQFLCPRAATRRRAATEQTCKRCLSTIVERLLYRNNKHPFITVSFKSIFRWESTRKHFIQGEGAHGNLLRAPSIVLSILNTCQTLLTCLLLPSCQVFKDPTFGVWKLDLQPSRQNIL